MDLFLFYCFGVNKTSLFCPDTIALVFGPHSPIWLSISQIRGVTPPGHSHLVAVVGFFLMPSEKLDRRGQRREGKWRNDYTHSDGEERYVGYWEEHSYSSRCWKKYPRQVLRELSDHGSKQDNAEDEDKRDPYGLQCACPLPLRFYQWMFLAPFLWK